VTDVVIAVILAVGGIAITSLPVALVTGGLAATVVFADVLDAIKIPVFVRLRIA
jgi:H+-transporting ATPase